jgi:branched-chain amino acid transport system permease protein
VGNVADPVLGVRVNGTVLTYYPVLAVAVVLFLLMLRIVRPPARTPSGPDATLSCSIMVNVLLAAGGMGTLCGPALGAALIALAQYHPQSALQAASDAAAGLPLLPACSTRSAGCSGSAACSS